MVNRGPIDLDARSSNLDVLLYNDAYWHNILSEVAVLARAS
jgi:hypothetical protein